MKLSFTGKDVVNNVRKLAQECPSFVYNTEFSGDICYYTKGSDHAGKYDNVGCIIGQALILSANSDELEWLKDKLITVDDKYGYACGSTLHFLKITASEEELKWLTEIQFKQDTGYSWENAVAEGDSKFQVQ